MRLYRLLSVAGLLSLFMLGLFLATAAFAQDHVLIVTHQGDVNRKITAYALDGTQLFSHNPGGALDKNHPSFIKSLASEFSFIVSCHDADRHHGGSIQAFRYGALSGSFSHVTSIDTGETGPFHITLLPDNRFCVATDAEHEEDGTLTVVDGATFAATVIPIGSQHTTIGYAGDASGYDIIAALLEEDGHGHGKPGVLDEHEEEPGKLAIIDGTTLEVRALLETDLPLLHSVVYSKLTQRVYVSGMGGLVVLGTQGTEKDVLLPTIEYSEERLAPWLKISPDGRYIFGLLEPHDHDHSHGKPGAADGEQLNNPLAHRTGSTATTRNQFFRVTRSKGLLDEDDHDHDHNEPLLFAYDLVTDSSSTLHTVQGGNFAYSPNGQWLVIGDIVLEEATASYRVDIIRFDPDSGTLSQEHRFILPLPGQKEVSTIASESSAFSPDSKRAYLPLPEADQIMVVDVSVSPPEASFLDVEIAPHHVEAAFLPQASGVHDWGVYR